MRHWRALLVGILLTGRASAQVVVTPQLITGQSASVIFCGLKKLPTPPLVQFYCYQTITTAFDTLSWNIVNYPTSSTTEWNEGTVTDSNGHTVAFQWRRAADGVTINWQVTIDALPAQSGAF